MGNCFCNLGRMHSVINDRLPSLPPQFYFGSVSDSVKLGLD